MLPNSLSWLNTMLTITIMWMENFPTVLSLRMVSVMRLSRVSGISVFSGFLIWWIVVGFWKRILLILERILEGMLIGKENNRWIVGNLMTRIIRDPVIGRN